MLLSTADHFHSETRVAWREFVDMRTFIWLLLLAAVASKWSFVSLQKGRERERASEKALSIIYFKNCRPCISIYTDNEWTAWVHCERERVWRLPFFFFYFIIWLLNQCLIRGGYFAFLIIFVLPSGKSNLSHLREKMRKDCNCSVRVIFKWWPSIINYCLVVWSQNTDLIVST